MTNVRYLVVFTKKQAEPKARTRRMPRYVHSVPSMGLLSSLKRKESTRGRLAYQTCVRRCQDLSNPSFGNSIYPRTTGHVVLLYIIIHNSSPLVLQIYWFTSLGISFKYHTIIHIIYLKKTQNPPTNTDLFPPNKCFHPEGLLQLCASLLRAVFVALQFLQPSLLCDRRGGVPPVASRDFGETFTKILCRENVPFKEWHLSFSTTSDNLNSLKLLIVEFPLQQMKETGILGQFPTLINHLNGTTSDKNGWKRATS